MNFEKSRYDSLVRLFEDWWNKDLDRPIIQVTLENSSGEGGDFFASNYRKVILDAMYDFDLPVSEVPKIIDKAYDCVEYYGDAIPVFYMRPTGILGGFLGQTYGIDHKQGTVWFNKMCPELSQLKDIQLQPDNPLLVRALEITKSVQEYFQGRIAVGLPDFGGVMDIVSSIRDANPLLMELCLEPDDVTDACMNIHEQFKKAYGMFMDVIDENSIPGYTCWATMLSKKPYFVLQNDFSAMISTDMYDEFYLPILQEECRLIPRTIYHLDGPGAVRHLDSILTVPELDGVQWINGAGAPGLDKWPDIYKKIHAAGKLCQVFINGSSELSYIDYIVDLLGTAKGLCFICSGQSHEKDAFDKYLQKYGAWKL
ncbi:MAG: hypothetical protein HUJ76_00755 [Parasporobacterium sp.]|nr:hypothetical protein [Parasporobacterium sp.]